MTHLSFSGRKLEARDGQTVLECLEHHGIPVVSSCRAGVCQSCTMRAVAGEIPAAAQAGLKPAHRAQGHFLTCQCPVEPGLEVVPLGELRALSARVAKVEELSGDVLRVRLELEGSFAFRAGQFVQLVRADGLSRAYSIANLPDEGYLELHVALLPDGKMSGWLRAAVGETVEVRGPQGDCFYMGEPDEPLLLAGTGTGLAPLLGVLRAALKAGHRAPITLIHGVRNGISLYERKLLEEIAKDHPHVTVLFSVLSSGEQSESVVEGVLSDPIDQIVSRQSIDPETSRVYLCGNPEIVAKLKKKIYIAGASLDRIHSDPFSAAAGASA